MAAQNDEKKARLDRPYAGRRSMQEQSTNSDAGKEIPVLCRQIRFFRELKKIEQKELAEKVGIKSNAVSNWENGRTRPILLCCRRSVRCWVSALTSCSI